MSIASIGVRAAVASINTALWDLRTTSAVQCSILQLEFFSATATAQSIGFGRPASLTGSGPTTAIPVRHNPGDAAAVTTVAVAWTTVPNSAPAQFAERWNGAATIGVGVVWTFPRGFVVGVSGSAILWAITATVAADVNVTIDE